MNYTEFYEWVKGKRGTIYTCRMGTYMAFCLDGGATYLLSTLTDNGRVIKNPSPEFWAGAIDFAGSYSTYFTYRIMPVPTHKMPYKADPILPITRKQIEKLKEITDKYKFPIQGEKGNVK